MTYKDEPAFPASNVYVPHGDGHIKRDFTGLTKREYLTLDLAKTMSTKDAWNVAGRILDEMNLLKSGYGL